MSYRVREINQTRNNLQERGLTRFICLARRSSPITESMETEHVGNNTILLCYAVCAMLCCVGYAVLAMLCYVVVCCAVLCCAVLSVGALLWWRPTVRLLAVRCRGVAATVLRASR